MRHSLFSRPLRSYSSLRKTNRPGWVCTRCGRQNSTASANSSSARSHAEKPYYVTTPIFYVNAAPHVGHLYSMVLADILKRWHMLLGERALLCTGTDEHGMKVQQAAKAAGSEPKAFCDKGAEIFRNLAGRAQISNDYFARTTDPKHGEAVQYAWMMLKQKEHIYLSKHEGWYSVSDETFYPESGVQLGLDPVTGRKRMVSIESGKEVEWTSETNYRFRLSAFREPLLEFFKERPDWIIPRSRMNTVVQAVTDGLDDLSVSRPSERLTWGIPVPDDPSQTIYVWLDALMNYVVQAGYPWSTENTHDGGWPADCHIIGKDILRFHCIYWPAFLMALGVPRPRSILTHAHWTIGREKMSKSTGNVVNPFHVIDNYGVDIIRYYLAHDGGINDDADYNNYRVVQRYKEVRGGLGNLVSRITRSKLWNVRNAISSVMSSGKSTEVPENEQAAALWRKLRTIPDQVKADFGNYKVSEALRAIMDMISETNAFFHATAPWDRAKAASPNQATDAELNLIIFISTESLRISGILLKPFMPTKAEQLLDLLGVVSEKRDFHHAKLGMDDTYGVSKVPLGRGLDGVLFPPLATEH